MDIEVTKGNEHFEELEKELNMVFDTLDASVRDESSSEAHDRNYAHTIINFMQYALIRKGDASQHVRNVDGDHNRFVFPTIDVKLKANKHFTSLQDFNDLVIDVVRIQNTINSISENFNCFIVFHQIPYRAKQLDNRANPDVYARLDVYLARKAK
jgi:hypothetical protein